MKISTSPAIFFLIDSFYKGYFFSALGAFTLLSPFPCNFIQQITLLMHDLVHTEW